MSIFSGIYGSGISSNSYNSAGTERTGSADSTYVKNPETSNNTSLKNAVPGSTIEGTVVSSNGDTATIDFGGGVKVDAKIEGGMELAKGQTVTFELKSTSGSQITLSPLYTNMSSESPVIKALTNASLPISENNISITNTMMNLGMRVDSSSLADMVHLSNSYPEVDPTNLVYMKQYGIDINQDNVANFQAFKEFHAFVTDGINEVANEIPETINSLIRSGDDGEAYAFLKDVIDIFTKEDTVMTEGPEANSVATTENQGQALTSDGAVIKKTENPIQNSVNIADLPVANNDGVTINRADGSIVTQTEANAGQVSPEGQTVNPENVSNAKESLVNDALNLLKSVSEEGDKIASNTEALKSGVDVQAGKDAWQSLSVSDKNQIIDILKNAGLDESKVALLKTDGATNTDFLKSVQSLLQKGNVNPQVKELISSEKFADILKDTVKDQWLLKPDENIRKETIASLYEKLESQTKQLTDSLSSIVRSDMPIANSLSNMNSNMDFMNQMNHMYQYVQIPLKMNGSEATGDLFVYTNKKNLANNDGNVSALLHLDMANLGPVDVYASITPGNNVFTKFYLADDATIDFINDNIHILTERLEKRGYNMKSELVNKSDDNVSREDGLEAASINGIGKTGQVSSEAARLIKKYSFDMRA